MLVKFAKFLSRDVSALSGVKMDRIAAIYNLNEGLSYHNHKELVNKMIKYPSSINMDERASNSNKHVFSILVSFLIS